MDFIRAIVLGIVQGATEFLPISSSGHLSIFQHFIGTVENSSMLLEVLLHLGTLIAVVVVYYKTIWKLILAGCGLVKDIFTGKFKWKELKGEKQMFVMFVISCIPLLLLLVPIGNDMMVKDFVSGLAKDNDIIFEGCALLFTGALLLLSTYLAKRNAQRPFLKGRDAIAVGVAQVFATLPGVSRSGSTISTGMLCGVSKEYMVSYSFILGIPAILAANVLEVKDAIEQGSTINPLAAVVGLIVAAVVGFFAIKLLELLVKKDKFKIFGYYCFAAGLAVIIAAIVEKFI